MPPYTAHLKSQSRLSGPLSDAGIGARPTREGTVSYAAIMGVTAVLAVGAVAYLYFKDVGGGK